MFGRLPAIPAALVSSDGKRLHGRAYLFLVLLCLAFFLPGLTALPPTDRDESLFAQASKQMIETGNFVDIRYQNEPRYKKPIGIYWLQAASVKLLNPGHLDEIWAYRIPSVIGATVAVVMTACLGAFLFSPMAGLLAAIMMAGCVILNVEARIAKTDAALLGVVMVMQYALARAYIARSTRFMGTGIFLAFWGALGAGILLKGPIILLILFSTLLWLRLTEKNLSWFRALKPVAGIPLALLLTLPWFAAIMLASHGQFIQQSAGHDLLGKLWHDQGRGLTPPGLYFAAFLLTFFPFSLWGFLAIPDSWAARREPGVRFCLGWIVPVWIAFELAFAKLPHYVMPVYPAIAMLAAKAMLDGFPALARRRWLAPLATALWIMTGMGLALAAALLPHLVEKKWNTALIAASLVLLMAQGACLMLFFRRRESGVMVMAAAALFFITALFASALPYIRPLWMSREIVETAATYNQCAGKPRLVSSYNEPSLVFLAGTDTLLINNGDDMARAMRDNPCLVAAVKEQDRQSFMQSFPVESRPLYITTLHGFDPGRTQKSDVSVYVFLHGKCEP
ncbi:MAG: ArnT family glycosyltransferase [Bdellovibrionales bacterium]